MESITGEMRLTWLDDVHRIEEERLTNEIFDAKVQL